jgi:hypothetical protein
MGAQSHDCAPQFGFVSDGAEDMEIGPYEDGGCLAFIDPADAVIIVYRDHPDSLAFHHPFCFLR